MSELLRTARANRPPPAGVPVAKDERTVREPELVPAAPVAPEPTPVATAPKPTSDEPSANSPTPGEAASPAATVTNADVTAVLADTTALVAQGRFRQALELLQLAVAGAAAADQPLLQQCASDLRRTARTAADQLVDGARTAAAQGRAALAIAELEASAPRFPTGPEFEVLPRAIDELRQKLRADAAIAAAASAPADEASRRAAISEVAPLLEQIRVGETAGDFSGAAALLQRAAAAVRAPDPGFAGRLQERAAEFEDLAHLHRRTAEYLGNGKEIEVALRTGENGRLRGVDGFALLVRMQSGDAAVGWFDLGTDGVKRIAQDLQLGEQQGDRAALGAAVLLYRGEAAADAEALLAKVLQQDKGLKGDVDRTIARGRGDYPDPRGYALGREGFTGVAAAEAQKAAQKVLARIDSVVRGRDAAAREAMLRDALALGPASLPALVAAFEQRLDKEVRQIDASPLRKQLEKLAAQRRQLDEARAAAKELIYDETKYFYPYAPPQVSSDRYAEYNRVQAEVEKRVAALRSLWDDDRLRVRVPASLAEGLGRIDWLGSVLSELGELDPLAGLACDWARALPRGEAVTIQNYCTTAAERAELDEWRRIEARNTEVLAKLPVAVKEQVRITNDYRAMFRHRPLAVDDRLCAAAGGHADEMSKLGYFSHFSPTPGRRTPSERMRLCGYLEGVSENIALTDSASSAHLAWCRSSGHHRNLLMATHTEVGIGGNGRYWVQNFGHGTSYRDAVEQKGR